MSPAKDHIDKNTGRHLPTLPPMEKHPDLFVLVEERLEAPVFVIDKGEGQFMAAPMSDPQLRWLINELGSAWSRVYGKLEP